MWNDPEQVVSVAWQMRQSDYIRGKNRALVNRLFNGAPPYTAVEAEANNIEVNVNFLEGTTLGHDARAQFNQAFQKPGAFFSATTDSGPVHKRQERGRIASREVTRIMKRSLRYMECNRSIFAGLILHGIGPAVWRDRERWCPRAIGVEDLLVPANTDLTFDDVPFFVFLRSYTARELIRLAKGPKVDKGWNKKLVDQLLDWIDRETMALIGSNFPDIWSPEKVEERLKGDGVVYSGDQVPTVNAFDFWFYSDEGDKCGWRRRIVVDDWSSPSGISGTPTRASTTDFARNQWLYDGGDRVFADNREQIFSCQFGDLSAVPPFRYHSVRSLGYLVYAACHLQNRLRCRFAEAVFENMMMYFRTSNTDDAQRDLKIDLINRGFIPNTTKFVPPTDRWQIDKELAELGLQENSRLIARHSSSFTSSMVQQATDKREKTKFEVMSEVSATTQLIGAALGQAYEYKKFEYREIFRRFQKKNSTDPDVREFQNRCLKQGIPENLLYNVEAWEIEPERVMGAGNKAMELQIAQQLLAMRNLYDPQPQRQILRDITLAVTDDPSRAQALVPDAPHPTDATHDAQLRFGTLMAGVPIPPRDGVNPIESIDALLASMSVVVQRTQKSDNVGTKSEIVGLATVGQHIAQEIARLAQDESEKQRAKIYGDQLGQLMNLVKGFAQRLAKQNAEGNGNGGIDPEALAKIEAMLLMAKAKAANTRESHAARTAQKQISWEMEEERKAKSGKREARQDIDRDAQEIASGRLKAINQANESKSNPES